MSAPALEVVALTRTLAGRRVLDGVSLTVPRGCLQFVLGASGGGKSVLIKHVVGLMRADAGTVRVDGITVRPEERAALAALRRRCQMVFQGAGLFEHLDVLDNVMLPLLQRGGPGPQAARARAEAALAALQLGHVAARLPVSLGSGMHKRVAIARALALAPTLILYDEPTTSLDPVEARPLDRLMRRMQRQQPELTQVVVSHDLESVRQAADRVAFLHAGRLVFTGSVTDFFAADEPAVRAFLQAAGPPPAALCR